jgi:hypothetical protein
MEDTTKPIPIPDFVSPKPNATPVPRKEETEQPQIKGLREKHAKEQASKLSVRLLRSLPSPR